MISQGGHQRGDADRRSRLNRPAAARDHSIRKGEFRALQLQDIDSANCETFVQHQG